MARERAMSFEEYLGKLIGRHVHCVLVGGRTRTGYLRGFAAGVLYVGERDPAGVFAAITIHALALIEPENLDAAAALAS